MTSRLNQKSYSLSHPSVCEMSTYDPHSLIYKQCACIFAALFLTELPNAVMSIKENKTRSDCQSTSRRAGAKSFVVWHTQKKRNYYVYWIKPNTRTSLGETKSRVRANTRTRLEGKKARGWRKQSKAKLVFLIFFSHLPEAEGWFLRIHPTRGEIAIGEIGSKINRTHHPTNKEWIRGIIEKSGGVGHLRVSLGRRGADTLNTSTDITP